MICSRHFEQWEFSVLIDPSGPVVVLGHYVQPIQGLLASECSSSNFRVPACSYVITTNFIRVGRSR